MSSSADSHSEVVLALAEEFLDRYRRGERPALREYAERHPDLAAEIREVFPAMALMENIALADESLADQASRERQRPEQLEQLGDYRIIREVGRGGMGLVYEAEQVSLGRHVALKVLPRKMLLESKERRRFEREAKAAAKLHHTNIVPVFGVGEHDGVPYYVMQFIQGLGLDQVLAELRRLRTPDAAATGPGRATRSDVSAAEFARSLMTGTFGPMDSVDGEPGGDPRAGTPATGGPHDQESTPVAYRPSSAGCPAGSPGSNSSISLPGQVAAASRSGRKPTYWQSIARIGLQVADALDYAHRQGVLHRDIKPSNLLLDLRGTVWVTDFGLAKADDSENLTHTGDILGTLRYMPPEAFEGKADARADVYALGLTLYELLTLQPAFGEKDKNQLIKHVTTGEPAAIGRLAPAMPRDLQTIVHKAIERDPGHRYATAAALADDLRRFVDDEPIHARTIGPAERAWRWCRRNPAVAGLLTAVVIVTALGFATTFHQMEVARDNAVRADASAADAMRQMNEADDARRAQEKLNTQLTAKQDELSRTLYAAHLNLIPAAWQGESYTRVLDLLEQHRPKVGEPDLRGFEWYYWKRSAHRELAVFQLPVPVDSRSGRTSASQSHNLALSADGARAALVNRDGVRVWDLATGRRLLHRPELRGLSRLGGSSSGVIAFAPGGRRIAVLVSHPGDEDDSDAPAKGAIAVVEIEGGREPYLVTVPADRFGARLTRFAFSPDGDRLAVSGVETGGGVEAGQARQTVGTIAVHDLVARRPVFQAPVPGSNNLGLLEFLPDGRRLVTSNADFDNGRSRVRQVVLDAATGAVLPDAKDIPARLSAVSPDGRRRVVVDAPAQTDGGYPSSRDLTFTVTEADGKELWAQKLPQRTVGRFRFSPDGARLASVPMSSFTGSLNVRVWDAATGSDLPGPINLTGELIDAAFRPDGRLVTLNSVGEAKTYDTAPPPKPVPMVAPKGTTFIRGQTGVTPDGRYTAAELGNRPSTFRGGGRTTEDSDPRIAVSDETGREVFRLPLPAGGGGFAGVPYAISPDGSKLAVGRTTTPSDMRDADRPAAVDAGRPPVLAVWDITGRRELWRVAEAAPGEPGPQTGGVIAFSPDGRLVAQAELYLGRFGSGAPAPEGAERRQADWRREAAVTVWEAATGQKRHHVTLDFTTLTCLAFSPDGRRLAVAGSRSTTVLRARVAIEVIDLATAAVVTQHDLGASAVPTVLFSPEGRWLATVAQGGGADGRRAGARLWPGDGRGEAVELADSSGPMRDLAFSPDGARVATLSSTGVGRSEVKVWDPASGRELLTLPLDKAATAVRFSVDGHAIHVFESDGRRSFNAAPPPPDLEAADVVERLPPATTAAALAAEIDRLALGPALKARVVELAKTVPLQTSPTIGHIPVGGRPENEYRAVLTYAQGRIKSALTTSAGWLLKGAAHYRLGQNEEGLTALKKAEVFIDVAVPPSLRTYPPLIFAFQAMAHHRLGQTSEAAAALRRARDSLPPGEPQEPIKAILAEAEQLIQPK